MKQLRAAGAEKVSIIHRIYATKKAFKIRTIKRRLWVGSGYSLKPPE
jgi:hypothetical protein